MGASGDDHDGEVRRARGGVRGEALIRPELYLRIIERLKRYGVAVRTISNGTLVTREIASAMVRHGLDIFSISVDAARPETYRGSPTRGARRAQPRELLALPLRRAFRRNPVLRRVKPFLKKFL